MKDNNIKTEIACDNEYSNLLKRIQGNELIEWQHALKTWPGPFSHVWNGTKKADLRKNDRAYKAEDYLLMVECISPQDYMIRVEFNVLPIRMFTGRWIYAQVTHVQDGFGLKDDYVMFSLSVKQKGMVWKK